MTIRFILLIAFLLGGARQSVSSIPAPGHDLQEDRSRGRAIGLT
jgi:hypothetical protein